ncbi:MAG: GMC family oxidoreductase [Vicinamibacterales bacterium]
MTDDVYDAVVVGAGAAGCVAADTLTAGGLTVLLLDAGPRLDARRDFPTPVPANRGALDRRLLAWSGQPVQARGRGCSRATRRYYVDDREHPYETPPDAPFYWLRGRQVGGRLVTWGRVAPRFSDHEFQPRAHGATGVDWPIAYADLAPYYAQVERAVGVHGAPSGLAHHPDGEYLPPRPLTPAEQRLAEVVAARWPTRRFGPAPVVAHTPGRIPPPLASALATGVLTLRPDAVATRVITGPAGDRAEGVEFVDRVTTRTHVARAATVVLCASAFETVRLLLNSTSPRYPDGLGNSRGLLGRFIMDHCMVTLTGAAPGSPAPPPDDAPADPYDMAAFHLYMPGFRNITEPAAGFTGSYNVMALAGRGGTGFAFVSFGEMQARSDNRLSLGDRRDAWGVPVARIDCRHDDHDRAVMADMASTLREIAGAAGFVVADAPGSPLGRLRAWVAPDTRMPGSHGHYPGASIHEMGGARMGRSPDDSVVNAWNQCWDVPNVVVADAACFPSSGYQNITLTIMAIAARAARHVVDGHGKG